MRKFKKATALLLAVLMVFSTLMVGQDVEAAETATEEYQSLVLEEEKSVTFDSYESAAYFSFTPEEEDVYIFKSLACDYTINPAATLYVKDQSGDMQQIEWNSYGGNYNNFSLAYRLEAGTTYYYVVEPYSYNGECSFNVILMQTPVESIEIQSTSVIENTDGYLQNAETENEFYYYWWTNRLNFTVTMKDGQIITGRNTSGFNYNGEWYGFSTSDNQSIEHWTVGNTYTATASVLGYAIEVPVSIVESPIQSVVVEPVSLIANSNGQLMSEGTEDEFYYYHWTNRLNFTVTMKDGQVITGSNTNGFYYNGEWCWFQSSDNQWNEHWTVGNIYTVTASVLGYAVEVPVSIVESPIQSMVIKPVSIIENSNGNLEYEGTEDEFYRYSNWTNRMEFTITMKDGQVITGKNAWGFNYNDEYYSFSTSDNQYEEHWIVGQTYTATVSVMGYSTEVEISIVESPVQSVVMEPITIVENTNGQLMYEGTEDEFYYYHWTNVIRNFTVTMDDGQVITVKNSNGFNYNGEWYHFSQSNEQYSEPWTAGNTYTTTASVMGYNAEVEVTIEESPIESIYVAPIVLVEGRDGYEAPNGFRYEWSSKLEYTVTMKDGFTIKGRSSTPIFYKDTYYWWNSQGDEQYQSPWYAGGTYNITVSILGKSAVVPVSIHAMNQSEGFEYVVQDGCAIIIGCSKEDVVLNIPSVIEGYSVIGITDLTYAMDYAEELVIPDSVTMLSGSIFEWNYDLKKLTIGKGISNIYNDMFIGATRLEQVIVSGENPYYCSIDGVVYDKEMKNLVVFPRAKEGAYTVPDTVTNIDCLINNFAYYKLQLDLGNSQTGYAVEDGVIYNADKTVIYACDKTKTGKYVMPDTVTTINDMAFHECSFSEVVVSENVSEIVYAAFSYSMELEKVVLPENLKAIGWAAFSECENLAEADLPSGLEILESQAFSNTSVTSVTIPGTVEEVAYHAYYQSKVIELTLEEGIEYIGNGVFAGTQLKNVVIPNSVTHLGAYVFEDTPLESVTFGSGLDAIWRSTFENTKLTTVTIPENIAEIGAYAFANSTLEEAIIERSDVYICEGAFYNCPLKEINLKEGVVAIGDYAFYGNQAETIIIPDSVTDVTYMSFAESKKLVDIDVPDELESIDGTAFDGTAWWDAQADGVVYLENYLYGYKGKMPEGTEITVKDGTTLIASYAFNNEYNLKTLSIPNSVKNIGHAAFVGCLGLEKVTIASDNTNYQTNDDGTVLYDQNKNTVWKKVEDVLRVNIESYARYGTSVEDWLASDTLPYVDVMYVDGSYGGESCVITADMVSGYDSTKLGTQTVTIDFGKFICETEIYIDMPVVESIKISKLPNKTVYDINQSFKQTGMVVSGVTADGAEIEITDNNLYDIYGFDSSEAGTKTITVVYDDLTATFEVEVTAERITFVADTAPGETSVQVSAPIEAMEQGAEFKCDEKPVEEIKETGVEVPEIFEQNTSQIFDIRFEKEEDEEVKEVQPAEGTKVTVSIPVPEGMDGRNSKIYHITAEGEAVDMKAIYSEGFMVFDTTHFSYYGIVEVNGSSISGLVNYTNVTEGDVTVTLSKDNEVCDTVTAVDGCYNFTGLEDGTYTLKIEKLGHATREYEVTVGGESLEQDGQICLLGDVNGDGKVNTIDVNLIYAHVKKTNLLTGYLLTCANVVSGETVNTIDVNRLYAHVKKTNPLW